MDGQVCTAKFIMGLDNSDGRFEEEMNDLCMRTWNVPFSTIRSMWIGRIGSVGNMWHLVELHKK